MNAPTPKDIRLTLEKRLYSILRQEDIKLSPRNKKFDPEGLTLWARATTQLGRPLTLERGEIDALGTRTGVFIVQLFLLPSRDISPVENVCAAVEAAFRLRSLDDVHCEEPYTVEVGLDADNSWYQFNVTVPFWTWVGK